MVVIESINLVKIYRRIANALHKCPTSKEKKANEDLI